MAKASKSSKSVSPVASAIAACFGVVYSALTDSAAQSAENKARGASRSSSCVAAIGALRDSIKDKAAFHDACVQLFGNGEKKKDVRIAGSLADKMKAEGIKDVSAFSLLHHCRTVAANWDNASVRKAATESGIRAGYDATKETASTTKAATPTKAKDVTLAELIARVIEETGPASVLAIVESALTAKKDPIRAKIVHDARVKLAA